MADCNKESLMSPPAYDVPIALANGASGTAKRAVVSFRHPTSSLAFGMGFFFALRTAFVFVSARWLNIGTEPGVYTGFACTFLLLIATSLQATGRRISPLSGPWRASSFRWIAAYLALSGCSFLWTSSANAAASAAYWC